MCGHAHAVHGLLAAVDLGHGAQQAVARLGLAAHLVELDEAAAHRRQPLFLLAGADHHLRHHPRRHGGRVAAA
ncbi:MAG: hypothetical protein ACK56F_25930, partial [bacterium]